MDFDNGLRDREKGGTRTRASEFSQARVSLVSSVRSPTFCVSVGTGTYVRMIKKTPRRRGCIMIGRRTGRRNLGC